MEINHEIKQMSFVAQIKPIEKKINDNFKVDLYEDINAHG